MDHVEFGVHSMRCPTRSAVVSLQLLRRAALEVVPGGGLRVGHVEELVVDCAVVGQCVAAAAFASAWVVLMLDCHRWALSRAIFPESR